MDISAPSSTPLITLLLLSACATSQDIACEECALELAAEQATIEDLVERLATLEESCVGPAELQVYDSTLAEVADRVEDIEQVLEAGAAAASMNSAAVNDPQLVREGADRFGSAKITVAVDARRNPDLPSGFELVVCGGTKPVGKDAIDWAGQCEDLGAGVILPTSMDGDGTKAGYDLEFTRAIADRVSVPVVASGGAGTLEHFHEGAVQGGAQVLLAASVFHYRILSIGQVKQYLKDKGLAVNL